MKILAINVVNTIAHSYIRNIALWFAVLPLTTQTPPTGAHSSGQGRPFYWLVCEGHVTDTVNHRQRSQDRVTASSSSARYDTERPHHRFESTHSNRWSPI